jgi:hypothetical protein
VTTERAKARATQKKIPFRFIIIFLRFTYKTASLRTTLTTHATFFLFPFFVLSFLNLPISLELPSRPPCLLHSPLVLQFLTLLSKSWEGTPDAGPKRKQTRNAAAHRRTTSTCSILAGTQRNIEESHQREKTTERFFCIDVCLRRGGKEDKVSLFFSCLIHSAHLTCIHPERFAMQRSK